MLDPVDKKNILQYTLENKCTILGVGPISKNCVDAAMELSEEHDIPIILIASRNQIDSKEFGGGYVNNWTTKSFSSYVRNKSKSGKIILARDHGGPWQNKKESENNLSLEEAMDSAKRSYKVDIDAGFKILHIDPSIDIHKEPSVDEILNRVFELYEYCMRYSLKQGENILFEIGTEEQSGFLNSNEDVKYVIDRVQSFCEKNNYSKPAFIVVQTGTKVKEMKNIGSFDNVINSDDGYTNLNDNITEIVDICKQSDILMKTHNMDYLSDKALQKHSALGVHAANVAPEFGVAETKKLVSLLKDNSLNRLSDRFLNLSYNSNMWKKWMLEDSSATDFDRAIIAGHYVYGTIEGREIKNAAIGKLSEKGIDLEETLKESVKKSISRYLKGFNLIN